MLERVVRAWRGLPGERRLAAAACLALFLTMFLPWYDLTFPEKGRVISDSVSAFGDFSFVEAAVLLVSVAVIFLLFSRAEGRAFHLPGGDGTVILAAGAWTTLLLAYRAFDKPDPGGGGVQGLAWGYIFAFAAAAFLAYAGYRVRAAREEEPPLPADAPARRVRPRRPDPADAPTVRQSRPAGSRPAPESGVQMTIDDVTRPHGSEEPLPRDE